MVFPVEITTGELTRPEKETKRYSTDKGSSALESC